MKESSGFILGFAICFGLFRIIDLSSAPPDVPPPCITKYRVKVRNSGNGALGVGTADKLFKIGDSINAGYLNAPDVILEIVDSNYCDTK